MSSAKWTGRWINRWKPSSVPVKSGTRPDNRITSDTTDVISVSARCRWTCLLWMRSGWQLYKTAGSGRPRWLRRLVLAPDSFLRIRKPWSIPLHVRGNSRTIPGVRCFGSRTLWLSPTEPPGEARWIARCCRWGQRLSFEDSRSETPWLQELLSWWCWYKALSVRLLHFRWSAKCRKWRNGSFLSVGRWSVLRASFYRLFSYIWCANKLNVPIYR